jgi:subtilisin family serine protease
MKRYWILLSLAFAAISCQDFAEEPLTAEDRAVETRAAGVDGQDYYWYNGEKIYLTRNEKYVNVIADGKLVKSSKAEVAANTLTRGEQTKVLPFFERGEGIEPIGTSDIFYLKLKASKDIDLLKKMAAELGVQVIEEIPYTPCWYTLSILGSEFGSSIEASNYFYETGKFDDVDPAFMFDFKPSADDTDFWLQWGMNNTSYPGVDINVIPAWNITRGAGVKVAVVDSPIESGHTDLNDNMHSLSYNAKLKRTPSAAYGGDPHGTRVAGIIAAEKNGSQVTGVAYESKIIRVSHDLYSSSTFSAEMASGINWAWQNGADVINCSWGDQGGQVYNQMHSTVLENAIRDAMMQGRNINGTRKGTVVVFASGNYGNTNPGYIDYPGNFHSDILVVGAIESNGNRWNSSSYGNALDVVAPGGSIWSTVPYSSIGPDSGTSFAAPHVSGIAALMLSVNPNLTASQVRDAIEVTAGNYPSWNNQTGWGLVDAHAAVSLADNQSTVQTAVDFEIMNYTASPLDYVSIGLTGNVGGSLTNMFYYSLPRIPARGSVNGYPNYPGNTFTATVGWMIRNLSLRVSATGSTDLRAAAYVYTPGVGTHVIEDVMIGGSAMLALPDMTVPNVNGQRRRVTVYISEQ